MAIVATTNQGWVIHDPQPVGASRPAPHQTAPGNPRELRWATTDIADLSAAMIWLVHTGNGGRLPDVPVRLAHSARPLGAAFGSPRSDHKALVATDINWDLHLWEESTGRTVYERADINNPVLTGQHAVFAAVEDRLAVSGRPVIRWCGRAWLNSRGWGYPVGYRDCMHWTFEGPPDHGRIKAAADTLRTWFVPPRTTADVIAWQARVGVKQDGQWGPASVAGMRALQRNLDVYPTGLPGDLATWRAWKAREDDRTDARIAALLTQIGYRDVAAYAADFDYTGTTDAHLITHLEDTMSKIDTLIATVAALPSKTAAAVLATRFPGAADARLDDVIVATWRKAGTADLDVESLAEILTAALARTPGGGTVDVDALATATADELATRLAATTKEG